MTAIIHRLKFSPESYFNYLFNPKHLEYRHNGITFFIIVIFRLVFIYPYHLMYRGYIYLIYLPNLLKPFARDFTETEK